MSAKTSDWRPGPTVCRCCFADGCYKDISTEYFWMGKREVYSEMLTETFSVSIGYQSAGPNSNSRLICEACIARLRDASDFKRQVQECEKTFMQHLDPSGSLDDMILESEREVKLETETVKLKDEKHSDDDYDDASFGIDDMDDDDDDLDDQPLTAFKAKVPKKEVVEIIETAKPEKRKAPTKLKVSPAKKLKKKEAPKPAPSKAPVTEKKDKKKDMDNALLVLTNSTAYPFRIRANQISCYFCTDTYTDPSQFRAHMAAMHDAPSKARHHLARHQQHKSIVRVDITDLRCKLCQKTIPSLDKLTNHFNDAHELEMDEGPAPTLVPIKMEGNCYQCVMCPKVFNTVTQLYRHAGTHFAVYVCEVCGKGFESTTGLLGHKKLMHREDNKKYCKICKKSFPTQEAKTQHRRVDRTCLPFKCGACPERFLFWERREQHMTEAHGAPRKVHKCSQCDAIYQTRNLLYFHFKKDHTDDNKCQLCGARFSTIGKLRDHIYLKHTGETPHVCPHCQKGFASRKSYTNHLKIHDDSKKHACPVCKHMFVERSRMIKHRNTHHPDADVLEDKLNVKLGD